MMYPIKLECTSRHQRKSVILRRYDALKRYHVAILICQLLIYYTGFKLLDH